MIGAKMGQEEIVPMRRLHCPVGNKCLVVVGITKGVVTYSCAISDAMCDRHMDGYKTCCCSGNNCNNEQFGKACSDSQNLKCWVGTDGMALKDHVCNGKCG